MTAALNKQNNFKEALLEFHDGLYQVMEFEKPYSFEELVNKSHTLIEKKLKPRYGNDKLFKNLTEFMIEGLICSGHIKIIQTPQGKFFYKDKSDKEKTGKLLGFYKRIEAII